MLFVYQEAGIEFRLFQGFNKMQMPCHHDARWELQKISQWQREKLIFMFS